MQQKEKGVDEQNIERRLFKDKNSLNFNPNYLRTPEVLIALQKIYQNKLANLEIWKEDDEAIIERLGKLKTLEGNCFIPMISSEEYVNGLAVHNSPFCILKQDDKIGIFCLSGNNYLLRQIERVSKNNNIQDIYTFIIDAKYLTEKNEVKSLVSQVCNYCCSSISVISAKVCVKEKQFFVDFFETFLTQKNNINNQNNFDNYYKLPPAFVKCFQELAFAYDATNNQKNTINDIKTLRAFGKEKLIKLNETNNKPLNSELIFQYEKRVLNNVNHEPINKEVNGLSVANSIKYFELTQEYIKKGRIELKEDRLQKKEEDAKNLIKYFNDNKDLFNRIF